MAQLTEDEFIRRLEPILARQIELYKANPASYVVDLPIRMNGHFHERRPNKTISLAYILACSLLATHRIPTAGYIARLMNITPREDGAATWQPHRDPELRSHLG